MRRRCAVCSFYCLCDALTLTRRTVDFTASAILNQFQDMAGAEAVERVLKKLATGKAQVILSVGAKSRLATTVRCKR